MHLILGGGRRREEMEPWKETQRLTHGKFVIERSNRPRRRGRWFAAFLDRKRGGAGIIGWQRITKNRRRLRGFTGWAGTATGSSYRMGANVAVFLRTVIANETRYMDIGPNRRIRPIELNNDVNGRQAVSRFAGTFELTPSGIKGDGLVPFDEKGAYSRRCRMGWRGREEGCGSSIGTSGKGESGVGS